MESTPTSRRRNILDNDTTMLRTISMTPRSQRRGWDRRRLHDAKMEPTSTYNVEMEPTEDIRGQGRSRRRRGCVVMSPVVTFDLATPPFVREWSSTQILSTVPRRHLVFLSTRFAGSDPRNRRVELSDWSVDAGNRVRGPVWTDIEVTPKATFCRLVGEERRVDCSE